MQRFEYKVVPAPKKGEKTRAAKTTPDRFAQALTSLMNQLGAEGWDYVRADTLPCEERVGLTGTKTSFQNMLVFRRLIEALEMAPKAAPPVFPGPAAPASIPMTLFEDAEPEDVPALDVIPRRRDHAAE